MLLLEPALVPTKALGRQLTIGRRPGASPVGGRVGSIDFIHYRGPLTVLSSDALWTGTPSQSNPSANAWSSDHAAVLTTFRVN